MREKQFWAEQELREGLARYKADPAGHPEEIIKAGKRIAGRYGDQRAIHSSSPRAAYIGKLAVKDPVIAAATAFSMIGNNPPHQDRVSLVGATLSAAYLLGLHTSPDDYSKAWTELLGRMHEERERFVRAAGEANDEWNDQREKITAFQERQNEVFASMLAKREIEFNTVVTTHTSKVDQIRDALKKDMSLKAAVTYFTDKASSHSKKAGWFHGHLVAVAGAVVVGAFAVATSVFQEAAQPSPVQIGLTVVCGFLALWLLRLLVRILLSNLHLATDLRNRATLVQTYLALLADGGGGLSPKNDAHCRNRFSPGQRRLGARRRRAAHGVFGVSGDVHGRTEVTLTRLGGR